MRTFAIERPEEIHFHFARGLPYGRRLAFAFALLGSGLVFQLWLLGRGPWWIGLPIVLAGTLLVLSRGYTTVVATGRKAREWRPATRAEVERILELDRRQKSWDQSAIDITCAAGLLTLLGVCLVVWIASFIAPAGAPRAFVRLNAAAMLLPFWVTGIRSILRNDALIVKCGILLGVERRLQSPPAGAGPGAAFQYQIQTVEAKNEVGEVPADVKGIVAFPEGPRGFLGVQLQIAINDVQGTSYPYFYAVLVARHGFDELKADRLAPPPRGVLLEESREKEVNIVVIRQQTTRRTGYHTTTRAVHTIFDYAVGEARRLLTRRGAAEVPPRL